MWCCMYPSSFFRFKKLVDQREIENNSSTNRNNNDNNNDNNTSSNQNVYNDYDSASITNNMEEFKSLFKTQEKACYELRSENTILKIKLEVANEMIRNQSKKIKSLKMKKGKLEIENNVYKNVVYGSSSLSLNSLSNHYNHYNHSNSPNKCIKNEEHVSHTNTYPPPPPPPLPLPPSKMKVNGNFQMNSVLDELKNKIKLID